MRGERGRVALTSREGLGPGESDTIVGVATPRGAGGVAIVRLSGARAVAIAETMLAEGRLGEARALVRRRLRLGGGRDEGADGSEPAARTGVERSERGGRVEGDEEDALVVVMPGPNSYTGEDVVEFHVHGGTRNVNSVVAEVLARGARGAVPGEFTRRAFDRGRLTLEQAEGIAAVIGARTDEELRQARRLVAGELGREVEREVDRLLEVRAWVEAIVDFSEDVDAGAWHEVVAEIENRRACLVGWLSRFEAGRRSREGVRVVLAGPVNAGKSSLFNALVGRARSIVSDEPGTTRDYVEAGVEVAGLNVCLVDTAGLREDVGAVEAAGVALARVQHEGADVLVWVEGSDAQGAGEGSAEQVEKDGGVRGERVLRVETKRDLGVQRASWLGVSSVTGQGIDELRREIARRVGEGPEPWIGLARHQVCVGEAVEALGEAAELGASRGVESAEVVAFLIGLASSRVAEVLGRSPQGPVGEEVLARVFERFCIGK